MEEVECLIRSNADGSTVFAVSREKVIDDLSSLSTLLANQKLFDDKVFVTDESGNVINSTAATSNLVEKHKVDDLNSLASGNCRTKHVTLWLPDDQVSRRLRWQDHAAIVKSINIVLNNRYTY